MLKLSTLVWDGPRRHSTKGKCVEPSGVQALKNPNPLKDDEG